MIHLIIGFVVAGAAQAASAQPPGPRDACALLTADQIRAVQESTVKDRKPSEHDVKALHFAQCFYATEDFARSVSLTVITGTGANAGTALRDYWTRTFHEPRHDDQDDDRVPQPTGQKKHEARPIPGAGDEAFWTGDARAGALYVRNGTMALRISVGGVTDENERIRRSTALARAALTTEERRSRSK